MPCTMSIAKGDTEEGGLRVCGCHTGVLSVCVYSWGGIGDSVGQPMRETFCGVGLRATLRIHVHARLKAGST
jgi:hypothetical protein